jgi:hypothetical protein
MISFSHWLASKRHARRKNKYAMPQPVYGIATRAVFTSLPVLPLKDTRNCLPKHINPQPDESGKLVICTDLALRGFPNRRHSPLSQNNAFENSSVARTSEDPLVTR